MNHLRHQTCIDACVRCAQECEHCGTACLKESNVMELTECIRLDKECAAACWYAAAQMSAGSTLVDAVCRLCADICQACAAECDRHADMHDHCRRCAATCHECADECRKIAGAIA